MSPSYPLEAPVTSAHLAVQRAARERILQVLHRAKAQMRTKQRPQQRARLFSLKEDAQQPLNLSTKRSRLGLVHDGEDWPAVNSTRWSRLRQNNISVSRKPVAHAKRKYCKVCGELIKARQAFKNYGALTCDNCRCFFRRSAHNLLSPRGNQVLCSNQGRCLYKMGTFIRKCRRCRFRKCLQVGMRPELIGRMPPKTCYKALANKYVMKENRQSKDEIDLAGRKSGGSIHKHDQQTKNGLAETKIPPLCPVCRSIQQDLGKKCASSVSYFQIQPVEDSKLDALGGRPAECDPFAEMKLSAASGTSKKVSANARQAQAAGLQVQQALQANARAMTVPKPERMLPLSIEQSMTSQLDSISNKYRAAMTDLKVTNFCVQVIKEYHSLGYKHDPTKLNRFTKQQLQYLALRIEDQFSEFARSLDAFQKLSAIDRLVLLHGNQPLFVQFLLAQYFCSCTGETQIMFLFGATHAYLSEEDVGRLRKTYFSDLCKDLHLFDHAKGSETAYYNALASFINSNLVGLNPAWLAYLLAFRYDPRHMYGFENPQQVAQVYNEVTGLILFGANQARSTSNSSDPISARITKDDVQKFVDVLQNLLNMMGHCTQWIFGEKDYQE